jgi:hypothetical protein
MKRRLGRRGAMSNGLVLPFLRQVSDHHDWSQSELAEFYRVESALLQAGFVVTTDRGVSDEGDPWFVFCRADNEEVIAHFARINREYVVVSSFHSGAVCGHDLRALIRKLLDSNPMTLPMRRSQGQKVFLHPAALLTALVASAYVVSNEKQLGGDSGANDDHHGKNSSIISLLMEKFSVFAAAALAATWIEQHTGAIGQFFEKMVLFHAVPDEHVAHAASQAPDGSALEAILHAIQNVELGHRAVLASDDSNLSASHQEHEQGIIALNLKQLPSPTAVAGDKPADLSAATFADGNTGAPLADNAPSHVDGSTSTITVQPLVAPRLAGAEAAQTDASFQLIATESAQSSASSSDALQVALSAIGNLSLQPVVLASGAVSLDQALQLAFQQVGLDTTLAQDLIVHNVIVAPSHGISADAQVEQIVTTFLNDTLSTDTGTISANPITNGVTAPAVSDLQVAENPSSLTNEVTAPAVEQVTAPAVSNPQVAENPSGIITPEITVPTLSSPQVATGSPAANVNGWSPIEVTISGSHIVVMDTNVADQASPNYQVVSYVDATDGITLSIVGINPGHSVAVAT